MAAASFKNIRERVEGDLADIASQLNFLASVGKLVPISGTLAGFVAGDAQVRPIVVAFQKNRIDDFNGFYQGLYVQVCSTYEDFIRKLIDGYVLEVADKDKTYAKLQARKNLLKRHTYHTGVALQQVFENRTNRTLDFEGLARNLASASHGSAAVTLNTDVFTLMLGALKPDGLQEALKRIGYDDGGFWDLLGGREDFKKYFNEKSSRAAGTAARDYLHSFVNRRNGIVHKGDGIKPVTETDISDAIRFFKILSGALCDILSAEL